MIGKRESSAVGQFVAEILEAAADQTPAVSPIGQRDLEAIEQRDYQRSLSRHFSSRELTISRRSRSALSGRDDSLREIALGLVYPGGDMNKKTFGQVLMKQRKALALSQRQFAKQLGVRGSHVSYLERGSRKPSLWLVRRIADELGLNGQELFLLSHPEAKPFLKQCLKSDRPKASDDSWRQFVRSRALLDQHSVTRAELKILRQVGLLRRVSSPRQFFFVLNSIRQASEDEWPVPG